MKSLIELKPEDLNPLKLSLISFGSIAGMGIGLLLSLIIPNTNAKVIVGISFICISLYVILKNYNLLLHN